MRSSYLRSSYLRSSFGRSSFGAAPVWPPAVDGLAAEAGNGTTTLTWTEVGEFDSVNIYRDGVLYDNVTAGVGTWTSGAMEDGLYEWVLAPVIGGVEGAPTAPLTFGCMTGDVWVDADNGSDTNDGAAPGSAVKTLNKAGTLVTAAGMRVVVRGGTYSEYNQRTSSSTYPGAVTTFTRDGTEADPCELRTFPGEKVIIDGSSVTRPITGGTDANRPELLTILGDFWLVAGWPGYELELRNSAGGGLLFRDNVGCIAEFIDSHNHEGHAYLFHTTSHCTLRYSQGREVYSTVNDGETSDGIQTTDSDFVTVHDCFFEYCGDDGVDFIVATNSVCYNTIVRRSGYFANGVPGNGNGNGFKMAHVTNVYSGNYFYNCLAVECAGIGFTFNGGGATVEHCTSLRNDGHGFAIADDTPGDSISIRHCMGYDNRTLPSHNMLYNNVTPDIDEYNSWNIAHPSDDSAFVSLAWSTDWYSAADVFASDYGKVAPASPYAGAGEAGQNLGYESVGAYSVPPRVHTLATTVANVLDDGHINSLDNNNVSDQVTVDTCFWTFPLHLVPPGAFITEAHLELGFRFDEPLEGHVLIAATDGDSVTRPTTSSDGTTKFGNLTDAQVAWTIPGHVNAQRFDSPDLKAILQELVDRGVKQTSVLIWMWPDPNGAGAVKEVYMRDGPSSQYPRLVYSWMNEAPPSPSEVTLTLADGLHDGYGDNGGFSNDITQLAGFGDSCRMFLYWTLPEGLTPGSEVLEAKLSLVPRNPETDAGSAFVRAHDVDSAAVPASWANISAWDDQLTTASVQWDVPAFNSDNYGTRLWSPDIKDVVQEIVDRVGFEEENAILFILMPNAGPSGEKFFYSYEYNSSVRPQLYIKWIPA